MKDVLGFYEILQVSTDADFETIKHSYRDLAKLWHPDSNSDPNATDVFQKLSIAYDVLSTPQSRLTYDILSLVYTKDNYPDVNAMIPFSDDDEGVDVKALNLKEVLSWGVGYKQTNRYKVATYNNALKLNAKVSLINWFAGWWHPKGFFLNLKAISHNFKNPVSQSETLKIMLHNMIAYAQKSQNVQAAKCGIKARGMTDDYGKKLIDEYVASLNVKVSAPKSWNGFKLKLSQTIVPIVLLLAFLGADNSRFISESELWKMFAKQDRINYYQTVNTGYGQSVDDVVVGKVVSIPVNKEDASKLYHLTQSSKVMYGPSDDFDVLKELDKGTTVRLTGYTPDKIWARVMIDNGESGFVHYEAIKQGIGKEIPFGSSIIE